MQTVPLTQIQGSPFHKLQNSLFLHISLIKPDKTMANHIASISSSSRALRQHEALETSRVHGTQAESASSNIGIGNANLECSTTSDLAKMSVMSLSDDDFDESLASRPSTQSGWMREKRSTDGGSLMVKADLLSSRLGHLDSIDDIDSNFDSTDLHHSNVLRQIDQKWLEISENLDATMKHLEDCSQQVSSDFHSYWWGRWKRHSPRPFSSVATNGIHALFTR